MLEILTFLFGSIGTAGIIAFIIFYFPEKAEKWWALFLKVLVRLGVGVHGLHKRYVQHEFQGSVNDFVRIHCNKVPGVENKRVRMEFIDAESASKEAILQGNSVVIRIRKNDPEDKNFVHAVALYVEKCLLFKAKKYISAPQGKATDLLVIKKLLEEQKPTVVGYFVDDYLHPILERKSRTAEIFEDLATLDNHGLFMPVYLREVNFLGQMVFGGPKHPEMHEDVDRLIGFLRSLVLREVGSDELETHLDGSYCRFGVVIVGKYVKVAKEGVSPYVKHIRSRLIPKGVNTIYLLAPEANRAVVQRTAAELTPELDLFHAERYRTILYVAGQPRPHSGFIAILRRKSVPLYYTKDRGSAPPEEEEPEMASS